jgi:uncharacterized protein (DUF302 family)
MIYKTDTTQSLQDVKANLEAKAKEVGFGVLGFYEFKKILKNKGFEIEQDITVYELCNPKAASQALTALPEISVYLPCRLSVYEEGSKTVLATIGIENILDSIMVDNEFKEHMQEIFSKVKILMNGW